MSRKPPLRSAGKRVFVAGHRGMVGSAIVRRLASESCEILTAGRGELDLTHQDSDRALAGGSRPDAVFRAAARGRRHPGQQHLPGDFLYENLADRPNVIQGRSPAGVGKLLFLGSSCIYPRLRRSR